MADLRFAHGINEADEFINIDDGECITGANFLVDQYDQDFHPRPPLDLKGTATNGSEVTGIMQMVARAGTITSLVAAGDTLYSWDGGSTFTSQATVTSGSRLRDVYWPTDDFLVITDLDANENLLKWTGTAVERLKTAITTGANQTVTSLTRSGAVATAVVSTHGFATGDLVTISGADQSEYNVESQITVTDANTWTFAVAGTPATGTGTIIANKGVELQAKYSAVFGGRLWLAGITADGVETMHMILGSSFEAPENFDTETRSGASGIVETDAFFLLTKDLRPVNGFVVFYEQLVVSTVDGKLFRLAGTSAADYEFVEYYQGSSATGEESIANIGNDVTFMQQGGVIDLLSATDRAGDVSSDDLSRWIPKTTRELSSSIIVYDQQRQKVFFFVADKVLVLDKGKLTTSDKSPWSFYTTGLSFGFNTKAAKYLRKPDAAGYSVYLGDAAGNIYDMNGVGFSGDAGSTDVTVFRKTRRIEELGADFRNMGGRVEYKRKGACTLTLSWQWNEEYSTTTNDLPLKGPSVSGDPSFYGGEAYYGAANYYNQGTVTADSVGDDRVASVGFSAVGRGPGFFLTTTIVSTVSFLVSRIKFDDG